MVNMRPERGGFMRPFGCGWFIREFLAGRAPEGAPAIDPDVGAPQQDIKFAYKEALYRAMARDRSSREISARVVRGEDITEEEAERIERYHYERIPAKITRMRYHSFLVYFGMLKRLGWVEDTGQTEPSAFQDNYPAGPPRKFYRLTWAGREAPDEAWSNPLFTLYPGIAAAAPARGGRRGRAIR
jgi:hypothetical protein